MCANAQNVIAVATCNVARQLDAGATVNINLSPSRFVVRRIYMSNDSWSTHIKRIQAIALSTGIYAYLGSLQCVYSSKRIFFREDSK